MIEPGARKIKLKIPLDSSVEFICLLAFKASWRCIAILLGLVELQSLANADANVIRPGAIQIADVADDIQKCLFSERTKASPIGKLGLVRWDKKPSMLILDFSRFDGELLAAWQKGMLVEVKSLSAVEVGKADVSTLRFDDKARNVMTIIVDEFTTADSLKLVDPFFTDLLPSQKTVLDPLRNLLSHSQSVYSAFSIEDKQESKGAIRGAFNIVLVNGRSVTDVLHDLSLSFAISLLPQLRYTDCEIISEAGPVLSGRYFTDIFTGILNTLSRPNVHSGDDIAKIRSVISGP
jgi:hypothetical protein